MSKVLVIVAHPGLAEFSKSQQVLKKFVDTYTTYHPTDEINTINLYDLDAPDIDSTVYAAFGKLMSGSDFSSLNDEEKIALGKRQAVIDQFIAHDKYVFAAPMWEFSFPAVLKKYLDIICAAKQTFSYGEAGIPEGLLKNRKAIFIQASGGVYDPEIRKAIREQISNLNRSELLSAYDTLGNFGEPIVKATLAIMGVIDYQHIFVGAQAKSNAAEVLAVKMHEVETLAKSW